MPNQTNKKQILFIDDSFIPFNSSVILSERPIESFSKNHLNESNQIKVDERWQND